MVMTTARPVDWWVISREPDVESLPTDATTEDSFYFETEVRELPPDGLALRRSVRLSIERSDGIYVVSDDFSDLYGQGDSVEEAKEDYRRALAGLAEVLGRREDRLDAHLRRTLDLIRAVLPDAA